MNITGANIIAGNKSKQGSTTFNVLNPQSGTRLKPFFYEATKEEIQLACEKADEAFSEFSQTSYETRSNLLEAIADEVLIAGNSLIQRCHIETALPIQRLENERERTVNQLRMFARLLRDGSWLNASIDTAQPDRPGIPKPDIRLTQIPVGPVAVFGASNFPLAFSVAGGDTASALAAGCPVLFKGSPSHPGTSEMVAEAVIIAILKLKLPEGIFSLMQGQLHKTGLELVMNPHIKALGFTGSFKGGMAIFEAVKQRPEPIPVYAEMGSVNPIIIFPEILKNKAREIAEGLVASVNLGVGQFCTKPGLVFVKDDEHAKSCIDHIKSLVSKKVPGTMLGKRTRENYDKGIQEISAIKGVEKIAEGSKKGDCCTGISQVFTTNFKTFMDNSRLEEEVFGPVTIIVKMKSEKDYEILARKIKGHLSISFHGTKKELKEHKSVIELYQNKTGRILCNEYPTGIEVCDSIHHGGPFPATTNPHFTSVGTNAIYRFTRALCYQNTPNELLPDELKNENPLDMMRKVNGRWTKDKIE